MISFLFETYELISLLFSIGFGLERSACTQNLVWAGENIHYELISLLFETYEFIFFLLESGLGWKDLYVPKNGFEL